MVWNSAVKTNNAAIPTLISRTWNISIYAFFFEISEIFDVQNIRRNITKTWYVFH